MEHKYKVSPRTPEEWYDTDNPKAKMCRYNGEIYYLSRKEYTPGK